MAAPTVLWKKRILVPFWIVRICLMLFIIAAYAWALKELKDNNEKITPGIGAVVVFMLFVVAVLLIDILAILLFLRDALHPGTFLTMNSFQTGFWIAVVIMDIIAVARGSSAVGLGFAIFVLFTFVALLIYAIIGYNRQKRESRLGKYAPAHNPAATTAPGYHPPAYMNAAPYQGNTELTHQTTAPYQSNTGFTPHAAPPADSHTSPYQGQGAAASYYHNQPVKPAQMV